jgi:hypothetical protein
MAGRPAAGGDTTRSRCGPLPDGQRPGQRLVWRLCNPISVRHGVSGVPTLGHVHNNGLKFQRIQFDRLDGLDSTLCYASEGCCFHFGLHHMERCAGYMEILRSSEFDRCW